MEWAAVLLLIALTLKWLLPDEGNRVGSERIPPCPDHKPRQHFDNKPAWCDNCGRTTYNRIPLPFPSKNT